MSDNLFKLQINLTKAYKGEDGNAYVEGIASGPEVDLTGERMSSTALQSMVKSIQKRLVEFRDAHKDEWNDDLGEIVELSLTDDNHLFYKARLDLNLSGAQDLWYRVHDMGKKLGVSIGGSIVKAGWEYAAELGKEVFTYFDVDLYEISITRQAAYQYSFANAVLKSLPKKEEPMSKSEQTEVAKTEAETSTSDDSVTTPTTDTTLTESEAAVETDAQEEALTQEETPVEPSEEAAEPSDAVTEEATETESTDETAEESTDAEDVTEDVAERAATDETESPAEASPVQDEEIAKALTEAKESVEHLKKSLDESNAKTQELQKSLTDTTTELETAQKSLAEKETELEKINARKAIVFDKFGKQEETKPNPQEVTRAAQTKFASFITGGVR
jgi:chemotaxis protein histidine kinase CheA